MTPRLFQVLWFGLGAALLTSNSASMKAEVGSCMSTRLLHLIKTDELAPRDGSMGLHMTILFIVFYFDGQRGGMPIHGTRPIFIKTFL